MREVVGWIAVYGMIGLVLVVVAYETALFLGATLLP